MKTVIINKLLEFISGNIADTADSLAPPTVTESENVRFKWLFKWIFETLSFNVCQFSDKEEGIKNVFWH